VFSNPQLPPGWRAFADECEQADQKLERDLAKLRSEREDILLPYAWGSGPERPSVSEHVKRVAEALYARKEQVARDEHKNALKSAETKLLKALGEPS
jgi:hypothetical protein